MSPHLRHSRHSRAQVSVKSFFQIVQKIMKRYLDLESVDDPKIRLMLDDQSDVRIATKMTAIFTKAVSFAMDKQTNQRPGNPAPAGLKRPTQAEARHEEVHKVLFFSCLLSSKQH